MRHLPTSNSRVLAIDLHSKGFGFAVLEGPKSLIDYGGKKAKGNKNLACLKKIIDLIEQYQPDVIILRNFTDKGSRRSQRVQDLTQDILRLALNRRIKVRSVSRAQVIKVFSSSGASTKHQIASRIAVQLPELSFRLPPARKPWMSEDERMSIFDAIALGLSLFHHIDCSTEG